LSAPPDPLAAKRGLVLRGGEGNRIRGEGENDGKEGGKGTAEGKERRGVRVPLKHIPRFSFVRETAISYKEALIGS